MILGSNKEQDQMTSHTRMTSAFFYFWSYLPFLCLNLICRCSVTLIPYRNILMMLGTNVEQDEMHTRMTTLARLGWRLFFLFLKNLF